MTKKQVLAAIIAEQAKALEAKEAIEKLYGKEFGYQHDWPDIHGQIKGLCYCEKGYEALALYRTYYVARGKVEAFHWFS